MTDLALAKAFLQNVWNQQQHNKGYAFLAYKNSDTWHDVPINLHERIEELPNKGRDLYFCPYIFSKPKRQKRYALTTPWLHADLDEVDPNTLALPATTAWETSPGRWQCLWLLGKHFPQTHHDKICQRLTYLTGADKGGWSITKLL